MTTNNYDASSALTVYYTDRTTKQLARHWSREKVLHDWADLGAAEFFEGSGDDPTTISGYALNKLWLRVEAGVTTTVGTVRRFAGGDATLLANWPVLDRPGFSAHIGAHGGNFDYAWSTATSGDPGTGKVLANNATLASATSINVSKTGRQGQSYSARIATWDDSTTLTNRGRLVFYSVTSAGALFDVRVNGAVTDNGTYYTVPIAVLSSGSIASGDLVGIAFHPTGDKGQDGAGSVDLLICETRTDAVSSIAPTGVNAIQTLGYAALGDGGGALYIPRVAPNPIDFTTSDARTWMLDPTQDLNPHMKGAKGDGTTNDAAAIQAIIDLAPDNSTIYFKGLTYGVGAAGLALSNRIGLWLEGRGAKLKVLALPTQTQAPLSFGSTFIKFDNCTGGGIRGFEINGNSIATNGIGLVECSETTVDGNIIYACGLQGLITTIGGTNNSIINNLTRDGVGASRGFWLGNVNATELETDCFISGNTSLDHGATAFVLTIDGFRFVGNHGKGCAGAGVAISGNNAVNARNGVLVGNKLHGNAFHGIQSDVSGTGIVYNIAITGNSLRGNTVNGVMMYHVRDWSVTGNDCTDNLSAGIQVSFDVARVGLTGNDCSDTRTGGSRTQDVGIQIVANGGDIDDLTLSGNTTCNNTDLGIQAVNVAGYFIRGLVINGGIASDNGTYGVFVSEAAAGDITGALVDGIRAENNATKDIRVTVKDAKIGINHYVTQQDLDSYDLDTGATPSVKSRRHWRANNGGATTVTALNNAPDGHDIIIRGQNANTTIQHNASIRLNGAVNATIPAEGSITLNKYASVWWETSRSF